MLEAISSLIAIVMFAVFALVMLALGFWLGLVALWFMTCAVVAGIVLTGGCLVVAVVVSIASAVERAIHHATIQEEARRA